jgi:hypothetical protein
MPISLRDHLEATAKAEEKRVNVLFGIAVAVALFVWVEIERRLGILNHAHEKAVEVQHTYVSEDIYDQDKKSRDEKIDGVLDEQARSRTSRATVVAVVTVASLILGIVVLFANGKI